MIFKIVVLKRVENNCRCCKHFPGLNIRERLLQMFITTNMAIIKLKRWVVKTRRDHFFLFPFAKDNTNDDTHLISQSLLQLLFFIVCFSLLLWTKHNVNWSIYWFIWFNCKKRGIEDDDMYAIVRCWFLLKTTSIAILLIFCKGGIMAEQFIHYTVLNSFGKS